MESLSEDTTETTEDRQYAAAIASRVYFHLEEPVHALRLACSSNSKATWASRRGDAYTDALVRAAIQLYVQLRCGGDEAATATSTLIDMTQLEQVVDVMLERCYADKEYTHALGIALESHHPVKLQHVLQQCFSSSTPPDVRLATLQYSLYACVHLVTSKAFRLEALQVIAEEYSKIISTTNPTTADWSTYCQIQQLLNRPQVVATIINTLLTSNNQDYDEIMAYQLGFDLVQSGDMSFVNRVASHLSTTLNNNNSKINKILKGGFLGELALNFLHKQSDTDPLIMEHLKKTLDEKGGRTSILHNCAVLCNSYMNAGTTNDAFLRDHLDWMKKASNWYVYYYY